MQHFSVFTIYSWTLPHICLAFERNYCLQCANSWKMWTISPDYPKVTLQIRSRYVVWRDYRSLDQKDKTSNLRTGNVLLLNLLSTESDLKLQIIFNMAAYDVSIWTHYSSSIEDQKKSQWFFTFVMHSVRYHKCLMRSTKHAYPPLVHPLSRSCVRHQ